MNLKQLSLALIGLGTTFTAANSAHAAIATVTSPGVVTVGVGDPTHNDTPAADTFLRNAVRSGSSIGIDGTYPHGPGNTGSVYMSGTDGSSKGDFEYFFSNPAGLTLGSLDSLSFDWYRASGGTAPAHLAPVLRLYYRNAAGDSGLLIWEKVYNGGAVVTDAWVSEDILAENFWMRKFGPGQTVQDFDVTLADWQNPGFVSDAPETPHVLAADTTIVGFNVGFGSGWNGSFEGAADLVTLGFNGNETTYDFEVPEPSTAALLALGGLAMLRRRA